MAIIAAPPDETIIVGLMDANGRHFAAPLHFVADNGYDTAAQQIVPIGVVSVG